MADSQNKYKRLITDIFVFVMGTVLTKAVQFALMPLYTTYMTTGAYGTAELTNNMAELLLPIVTLCIYEAAFRFVIGSEFNSKQIFSAAIRTMLISTALGIPVLFGVMAITKYKYAVYLYFILYAYSFRMLAAYYTRGKGYSKLFAASGVLNAVFLAGFTYLFLVVSGMAVEGYLLAIGLSYVGSFLFLLIFARLYRDITFPAGTRDAGKAMLLYSTPLIIYNVGYWLTTMSGRYILLYSKGASEAGVYAAVIKLAAVINMLQQAFYAAFQLNTAREYNNAEKEAYYSKIFKLYSAAIIVFGSMILAASPVLAKITLKGDFYKARVYLPLVLMVAIIDCMFCFYKTMYTTYKLTKKAVPSMLIGAAVNIVAGIALVGKYGILGICLASLLCYSIQALYRVIDVRKFVTIKCNWAMIAVSLLLMFVQVTVIPMENRWSSVISCACVAVLLVIQCVNVYPELSSFLARTRKSGS